MPVKKIKSILDYENEYRVLNLYEKHVYLFYTANAIFDLIDENKLKIDDDEITDFLAGYADGVAFKRFEKLYFGKCSLKDYLTFDIGEHDKRLDRDIRKMEKILYDYDKKKYLERLEKWYKMLPLEVPDEYFMDDDNIIKFATDKLKRKT